MADLEIDGRLHDLYRDLLHASVTFGDAEHDSKTLAGAVGHPGLEGKVRDFAVKWDNRRPVIIASLDNLWKSAQAIDGAFGDIDQQMGDALGKKG